MPIIHERLANRAELAGVGGADSFGVGGVPCCFVVGEDVHVLLARDLANGEGVLEGGGQGLLDHGVDAVGGCCLDGLSMVEDCGVNENGIGLLRRQHGLEVRVEKTGGEVVIVGVLLGQGCVWLGYAYELGVAACL